MVNPFCPTMVILVWGGGGRSRGGGGVTAPRPVVYGHSHSSLPTALDGPSTAFIWPRGGGVQSHGKPPPP